MKRCLLAILLLCFCGQAFANHIAGGELFYEYLGAGSSSGTSRYKITMRLFRDCNSTGQQLLAESPQMGIYNTQTGMLVQQVTLATPSSLQVIDLNTSVIPCLTNAPTVCYQVGLFIATVELADNAVGYTLAWLRCCRSDNIGNMSQSSGVGATYVTRIPGTNDLPTGHNSSPQFRVKDTALVCKQKRFTLDFGAADADGDALSYSFCEAYAGGTATAPNPPPSNFLSLTPLTYRSPYSGSLPLGGNVTIDPNTGQISGTAPAAGRYVINVCVSETRNGKVFSEHRKDFILQVGDCDYAGSSPAAAIPGTFPPQFSFDFVSCKSFTVNFFNNNASSTISSYFWDFGVPGIVTDTSTKPVPSYTYADTGVYTIKLVVKGANNCLDSNKLTIGVYPGFKGDFSVTGSCFKNPFVFKDLSTSTYGVVNGWRWNFGDASTTNDTSTQKNPSYTYPNPGTRTATLIVNNSKGCLDTVTKPVVVRDIPLLTLPFRDTLICTIDTLPLIAQGTGVFSWKPLYNIINPNTANPLVYPKDTTTYVVTLLEDGCIATDSIKVNTLDFITVDAGQDTTICRGDVITLFPISYGLQFQWTPASAILGSSNVKNPTVSPAFNSDVRIDTTVTYRVLANLGKCAAQDAITIRAVRYPVADAGPDDSVCYGRSARLNASIKGNSFAWSPTVWLTNPNTLTPTAQPTNTITYSLTVFDTIGCPKPSIDQVTVKVIPPVKVFAGNDTNIVVGQALQLNATGADNYIWTPTLGLNNPSIGDPILQLPAQYDSVTYTVKGISGPGCTGQDDITIVLFKTQPDIFVPSGFTPNGDGKNDVIRPVLVGLKRLNYFRIYNRWGQLLFTSTNASQGWDGRWIGQAQGSGTYVYMAEAVDYKNNPVVRKGTIVLIR